MVLADPHGRLVHLLGCGPKAYCTIMSNGIPVRGWIKVQVLFLVINILAQLAV